MYVNEFVCLLPDGTDLAQIALVNGAARVGHDAPDAYAVQQADAQKAGRGIWANPAKPRQKPKRQQSPVSGEPLSAH